MGAAIQAKFWYEPPGYITQTKESAYFCKARSACKLPTALIVWASFQASMIDDVAKGISA